MKLKGNHKRGERNKGRKCKAGQNKLKQQIENWEQKCHYQTWKNKLETQNQRGIKA